MNKKLSDKIFIARLLVESGVDVNSKNEWGQTPLHWPWSEEVFEILVSLGADPNLADDDGNLPKLYNEDSHE